MASYSHVISLIAYHLFTSFTRWRKAEAGAITVFLKIKGDCKHASMGASLTYCTYYQLIIRQLVSSMFSQRWGETFRVRASTPMNRLFIQKDDRLWFVSLRWFGSMSSKLKFSGCYVSVRMWSILSLRRVAMPLRGSKLSLRLVKGEKWSGESWSSWKDVHERFFFLLWHKSARVAVWVSKTMSTGPYLQRITLLHGFLDGSVQVHVPRYPKLLGLQCSPHKSTFTVSTRSYTSQRRNHMCMYVHT